jgi:hypothetical protein
MEAELQRYLNLGARRKWLVNIKFILIILIPKFIQYKGYRNT